MAESKHLTKDNPIQRIEFGPLPLGLNRRGIADEEARRDLTKEYEQLLADAHEEITDPDPNRGPIVNLGFSNRRLASIAARAAMAMDVAARESSKATAENLNLQKEVRDLTSDLKTLTITLKRLTNLAVVFAFIAVVCAGVQVYYAKKSYDQSVPTNTGKAINL